MDPTVGPTPIDADTAHVLASMGRVLRKLDFETHPLINRPVCAIFHNGEIIHFDETEIRAAAQQVLPHVIEQEISRFPYLPDVRLDHLCRRHLEAFVATHVPEQWTP